MNNTTTTTVDSVYQDLLRQREELDLQIAQARKSAIADAVAKVKQIVADFELTENDVFGNGKRTATSAAKRGPVAPKYQDPETGATWTGRGKPPKWIEGQDRELYLIDLPANDKAADN